MDIRKKLLEKVKSNPMLYNHSHSLFWDQKAKDEIWANIANELKMDPDTARKTYRSLRDGYIKNCKSQRNKRSKSNYYRYHEILSFIIKNSNKILTSSSSKTDTKDSLSEKELIISENEDDRALMQAIKCRPVLYNRDKVLASVRAAIWDEIGENLNRSGKDCMRRYRCIRDNLCRSMRAGRPSKYQSLSEFLLPWINISEDGNNGNNDEEDNEDCERVTAKIERQEDEFENFDVMDNLSGIGEEEEYEDNSISQPEFVDTNQRSNTSSGQDPFLIDADPLKLYFSTIYSNVKKLKPGNVLTLQKQIFDLVHEMQVKESREEEG